LPAGRVEIALPAGFSAQAFGLDLRRAEGTCQLGRSALKAFVSADAPVVLVWVPTADVTWSVTAPAAVAKLGYAPATAIDRSNGIVAGIKERGMTILLVEQNANMALRLADRGYVLEAGVVRIEGTSRDLRDNPEVGRAYLGH
jgi:hypothetical protein